MIPTPEQLQLAKDFLADLGKLTEDFLGEAHKLGFTPKYKNLPDQVKVGMLVTSISMLSAGVQKVEPMIYKVANTLLDDSKSSLDLNNHD